jgi:hypothetical protein
MMRRKHSSGMTLIEMLAAITVLMILTGILAEVFFQATKASSQGKAVAEVYQVGRAIRTILARDLSGATTNYFESRENGIIAPFSNVLGLPPGPFTQPEMRRMLAGGSDYLMFTTASAAADRGVCKVYYVLRETGQLVRIVDPDPDYQHMDYVYDALSEHGVDIGSPSAMDRYEEMHVLAENVARLKVSFLSRGNGPVSWEGVEYANGNWVEDWDWNEKRHLPAAVKVQLQLVDHLWNTANGDRLSNKNFNAQQTDDNLRASEFFDSDDGEPFAFIVDLPLGMRGPGS